MGGEPGNPRIELSVGEAAPAREIDRRRLVRCASAEMRDPVVIANGQDFPPVSRGRSRKVRYSGVSERTMPNGGCSRQSDFWTWFPRGTVAGKGDWSCVE